MEKNKIFNKKSTKYDQHSIIIHRRKGARQKKNSKWIFIFVYGYRCFWGQGIRKSEVFGLIP